MKSRALQTALNDVEDEAVLIYFEALAAGEKVAAACLMDQMDPGQLVDVIHVVDRWLVAMGVRVAE